MYYMVIQLRAMRNGEKTANYTYIRKWGIFDRHCSSYMKKERQETLSLALKIYL